MLRSTLRAPSVLPALARCAHANTVIGGRRTWKEAKTPREMSDYIRTIGVGGRRVSPFRLGKLFDAMQAPSDVRAAKAALYRYHLNRVEIPDQVSAWALRAFARCKAPDVAVDLVLRGDHGLRPTGAVVRRLLRMMAGAGRAEDVSELLRKMTAAGSRLDGGHLSSAIAAARKASDVELAWQLFVEAEDAKLKLTRGSLNMVLDLQLSAADGASRAERVLAAIERVGGPNDTTKAILDKPRSGAGPAGDGEGEGAVAGEAAAAEGEEGVVAAKAEQ